MSENTKAVTLIFCLLAMAITAYIADFPSPELQGEKDGLSSPLSQGKKNELSNASAFAPMSKREFLVRKKRIEKLLFCAKGSSCPTKLILENEPNAMKAAVKAKMLDELAWFEGKRAGNKDLEKNVIDLAHSVLSMPDEQIKVLAIQVLLNQNPRSDSVPILAKELEVSVDPELIKNVVAEFSRHLGTAQEELVMRSTENVILRGGIFTAREVAKNSLSLIYDGNRHIFVRWLSELQPGSVKYFALKDVISKFDSEHVRKVSST